MLPSCGHFKNIPCPFYKFALCVRPHCPYKHNTGVYTFLSNETFMYEMAIILKLFLLNSGDFKNG